jgi:hypothetical protein
MGAAPMRDTELLDWCAKLLGDVVAAPVAASAAVG